VTLLFVGGCSTTKSKDDWSPLIYKASVNHRGVVREQAKEVIRVEDNRFNEMFCMFSHDLEKLYQKCLTKEEAERSKQWLLGK